MNALVTKITVRVKPWHVPNFMSTENGGPGIPLRGAPVELVKAMLAQFEADVWEKVNMSPDDPRA